MGQSNLTSTLQKGAMHKIRNLNRHKLTLFHATQQQKRTTLCSTSQHTYLIA